ncbi:MAG: hypothetical protein L6R37_008258 [Teloschistes peruensis]|nr:MAG: hypothetical protein L6R37_008258 [Teloschistes peruensis]
MGKDYALQFQIRNASRHPPRADLDIDRAALCRQFEKRYEGVTYHPGPHETVEEIAANRPKYFLSSHGAHAGDPILLPDDYVPGPAVVVLAHWTEE